MQPHEALIIPYQASPVPSARKVLVFAPHPDDEVFGCGGAMALHVRSGGAVHVVLLTSGEFGATTDEYAAARLAESVRAAQILGTAPPIPWGLTDRALVYGEGLVQRMTAAIDEFQAETIYAPSPWELHPDHRATALAAMEAVRRLGGRLELMFYEVSAPLRPNYLVDLAEVDGLKQAAMQQFESQESRLPYASFINALNRFRALTLFPAAQSAEAFERYGAADLAVGAQLRIASELMRMQARGVAGVPDDLPLVSVVVRTAGRRTLSDALRSVAAQTYGHVEVLLVDAAGTNLLASFVAEAGDSVRIVSTGRPLRRAAAANAGLHAARGEYLLFLDDDDWLYPDHLAKLVRAVREGSTVRAAHTGVECVDDQGRQLSEVFVFPYAPGELRLGNFMPIHSVLFQRSLVQQGCAFDESFDLYEDWDFWLQVERLTPFAFASGISAAYRIHPGAGAGVTADPAEARRATQCLYEKWGVLQSAQTFDALITRALERRQLQRQIAAQAQEHGRLAAELEVQQRAALQAQTQASRAAEDAAHFRLAHEDACRMRDALREHSERVLAHSNGLARHGEVLTGQLEQARAQHELLREQLARQVDVTQQLEAQTQRLDAELALSRRHSGNLEQSLEASRQEVRAVLGSTSWRLTRSVRRAGRVWRQMKTALRAYQVARGRGMSSTHLAGRAWEVFRAEGLTGVRVRAQRLLGKAAPQEAEFLEAASQDVAAAPSRDYAHWVRAFDTLQPQHLEALTVRMGQLAGRPLVSVVMPVYNPQLEDLRRAIASVQAQCYEHWQLCICDDASTDSGIHPFLRAIAEKDTRIRVTRHESNGHISRASNTAIGLAEGDLVAFLDQDDELRPHALLAVVEAFQGASQAQVLYSDEDKITAEGERFDPYFKPGFNLGLLRSHNYMCHFAVYRRGFLQDLGGLREGFEGAQDYDLALRAVDCLQDQGILHVPQVLYHWRVAVGSTAAGHGNKSYAFDAGRRALAEHLQRRGLAGDVLEALEAPGMYRIRWHRPDPAPLVSIVIPTRNGESLVRQCLDSLKHTAYPAYEVILVDNGSDDPAALALFAEREAAGQIRVLRDGSPFNFSALNNNAVHRATRGEFVLLMNNDIEIVHPEWLDEMVGAAMEPGVGCVGARLWYPDGRLQHGGVILVCGVAGHAHKYLPKGQHGYMGRAVLAQDFVAVTAACLLVRRTIFDEVGGLDERLEVAFNDVDFCLRVHEAGYRNHWTPYAELVHHESVTRGYEDTPEKQKRFKREIDLLQSRWPHLLGRDPCYNPNLTNDSEDFSLAWPPRHVSLSLVDPV
ncbi:MAG: glycosyltransferase [Burkholderiaceae bacterium]|nr:MAG: glycosyltransferase [Burkholderiaceae bacterium]